ncbi:hypothetical protein J437_LFUL000308 [Ladona fulva]|uniref:LysM domain-containing protein n=1 Tax=Ladona fulva TaxID=123851 RepID=A0A8K0K2X7_LADFU|nr:hypothetical protein J437_LFUL000308 [Ladona fulva]
MKRGSFFSVTKERKDSNKQKNKGISYRKGSYKDNQYVFFQPSESEDEGEEELFVLQAKRKPEKFVVRVLQPGDTLANIAVQYGYSVEELKRINHIHKDNEIFARTTLKVPMRIMETPAVHNLVKDSDDHPIQEEILEDHVELVNQVRTVSISDAYRASKQEGDDAEAARRFLASMDRDLARIRESALSKGQSTPYDFSLTEVGEDIIGPIPQNVKHKADSTLNWVRLLICSLLLGFIAPIIYVIYLAEETSKMP